MKKQKAAYVKYNENEDSFELWIECEDGTIGFSRSAKCQALNGEGDTDFIHYSFMKEILNAISCEYHVYNRC